jgi:hypothetical protein
MPHIIEKSEQILTRLVSDPQVQGKQQTGKLTSQKAKWFVA